MVVELADFATSFSGKLNQTKKAPSRGVFARLREFLQ
jgi:hypothetical protein